MADPAPVYALDKGADLRARLSAAYPDRSFWVVDGPSLTDGDFVVIAGPLERAELLELELPDVPLTRPEVPLPEGAEEPGS